MTHNLSLSGCLIGVCVCVHLQDATRMASAGCVGELCAFLSEEELKSVLLQHVLGWYLCAKLFYTSLRISL